MEASRHQKLKDSSETRAVLMYWSYSFDYDWLISPDSEWLKSPDANKNE